MQIKKLTGKLRRFPRRAVRRVVKAVPHIAKRYGLVIVVIISLPLLLHFSAVAASERLRPVSPDEGRGLSLTSAYDGLGPGPREVSAPEFVRGIYMSSATAGHARRFQELTDLVVSSGLNSLVIDIKNHKGELAFIPVTESLKPHAADNPELGDLVEFTSGLREKGIYLIARNFVFQDPALAKAMPELAIQKTWGGPWKDYRGIQWLDPAAKKVWQYNVAVAREAFYAGFDEIQFDYIRFPSDGPMSSISYPVYDGEKEKSEVMADFFRFLDKELRIRTGAKISVDLFGLTMWNHESDMNIGQKLSDALPHFDFISPMVYPSHYPDGFNGYGNPSLYPYEVIYENMIRGQEVFLQFESEDSEASDNDTLELATIRPWLQDFDLGAVYTPQMVKAQMKATVDGGGSGWLLWNARNVYTTSALGSAEKD